MRRTPGVPRVFDIRGSHPFDRPSRRNARAALLAPWILALLTMGPAPAVAGPPHEFVVPPDPPVEAERLEGIPSPEPTRTIPLRVPNPDELRQAKERLARRGLALPGPESAPGPTQTAVLTSFAGIRLSETAPGQGFRAIPPDTQVAAGPNHLFVAVNVTGRILTKAGAVVATFPLRDLFAFSSATNAFDPKIRFDPQSGRWFIVIVTEEDTGGSWRLAVSKTNVPSGNPNDYHRYTLVTAGRFPDFPSLGISDDKVVLTANAFQCTTVCGSTFVGTEFIVLNKANLLSGLTANATSFAPDQGFFTIQAAHSLSSTSTLFMVANSFSNPTTSIRIWSATGVPGVSPVSAAFVTRSLSPLSIPPDADQPGTTAPVATNDHRFLDAVSRDGSLWVTGTSGCTPSGDVAMRSCLRYVEIATSTLTVVQDFDFGTSGVDHYFPAIQLDSSGSLLTVFSRSSASEFASAYASGRLATDALGTLHQPVLVKAGEAPYDPLADGFSERRWGDYSGAGIDPSDQTVVWGAGEYARTEGGAEWGVWVAKLQIAGLFADVPAAYFARPWIEALFNAGVTGGCATSPLRYCPTAPVTREQMAVFLLKAKEGAAFLPPPCVAPPFGDLPCSNLFAAWIQELATRGITAGCGAGNYCPASSVTRQEMAVFILRTLGVTPPACVTSPFTDVPCTSPFAPWIVELATRGITAGCTPTTYCPTSPVTRDQMAIFLVKAFSLPFP